MQALDLVRVQLDRAVAPTEADVRVMALRLGKGADLVDKLEGFLEVRELEGALDARALREKRPTRRLFEIRLGLVRGHRWNPASAGCARLASEFGGHCNYPNKSTPG